MRMKVSVAAGILLAFANPALADCKGEVDQAFSKLRGSKNFRLETKIVNEQQGSLTMTVDYILPDRMHQRVSLHHVLARHQGAQHIGRELHVA